MTGAEQAMYQRIPTDETEAQTLASADLDGIKSECVAEGCRNFSLKCLTHLRISLTLGSFLI